MGSQNAAWTDPSRSRVRLQLRPLCTAMIIIYWSTSSYVHSHKPKIKSLGGSEGAPRASEPKMNHFDDLRFWGGRRLMPFSFPTPSRHPIVFSKSLRRWSRCSTQPGIDQTFARVSRGKCIFRFAVATIVHLLEGCRNAWQGKDKWLTVKMQHRKRNNENDTSVCLEWKKSQCPDWMPSQVLLFSFVNNCSRSSVLSRHRKFNVIFVTYWH